MARAPYPATSPPPPPFPAPVQMEAEVAQRCKAFESRLRARLSGSLAEARKRQAINGSGGSSAVLPTSADSAHGGGSVAGGSASLPIELLEPGVNGYAAEERGRDASATAGTPAPASPVATLPSSPTAVPAAPQSRTGGAGLSAFPSTHMLAATFRKLAVAAADSVATGSSGGAVAVPSATASVLQAATSEAGGGSAGGADAESDPLAAVLAMMTAEERALWNAIQSVPTGPAPSGTGAGRRGGSGSSGDGVVLAV